MPSTIKRQPGCACCLTTCVIDTQDFATDGAIKGFTESVGSASQSGGVATIDPASVLITSKSSERPHMAVETAFSIDTEDAYIELRICWNPATDEYLFGRIYTAAAGEQAGKFEIGIYDGAHETMLQGPWYRYGLLKDETHTANLCYDGETLCLDVEPPGVESERCAAKVPSFTSPDGAKAGIATDSSLATYELYEWTFRRQADDPDNETALWCVLCESCREWTKSGEAFLEHDEYETSASVGPSTSAIGGLKWLTAGTVFSRNIYYTANIHRRHSFSVSYPGFGDYRIQIWFWYENASNYWYIDCPHAAASGSNSVAIYQVVGGVHTEQDRTNFTLQGKFDLDLCVTDSAVSAVVRQQPTAGNVVNRVAFGVDDVTPPEGWQIGVNAPANSQLWSHAHACVQSCEICEACESGFGAESYQIELTGAPCSFEVANGTYITSTSQVELENGSGMIPIPTCTYSTFEYKGFGSTLGVRLGIPAEPSDHPIYGESQQGLLVWVNIYFRYCDPRYDYRIGATPAKTDAEREAAINEYCNAPYGPGPDCDPPGRMQIMEWTFLHWIDESEVPLECGAIDWNMGLYDVYPQPPPTTPTDWPGIDLSSMSVRVRSLPLP